MNGRRGRARPRKTKIKHIHKRNYNEYSHIKTLALKGEDSISNFVMTRLRFQKKKNNTIYLRLTNLIYN